MRELPCVLERFVSSPAALGAWSVSGGECHGLIEEEKLGGPIRRHHHAMAAPEFQNARDPAPALVAAHDFAFSVVQHAATVAHHRAASGGPDESAEGIDAVL